MDYIDGKSIARALQSADRVYLCGDLKQPQELPWIEDHRNEMGLSFYKTYTADHPHSHAATTEYNYVLSGETKILLIDEGKELLFGEGSVFVLPPRTKYASKHLAGSRILFFKSPGGNDKELVETDETLREWLKSWE